MVTTLEEGMTGVDGTMETATIVQQQLSPPTSATTVTPAAAGNTTAAPGSLHLPPPSFSRLPPDGHEFPPNYMEQPTHDVEGEQVLLQQREGLVKSTEMTLTNDKHIKTVVQVIEQRQNQSGDNGLPPPLPKTVPPPPLPRLRSHNDVSVFDNKTNSRKLSADFIPTKDEVDNVKPTSIRKYSTGSLDDKSTMTASSAVTDLLKMKNWRKDPKSSCSVRDKIAMFSNTTEPEPPLFPCAPLTNLSSAKRLSKTFKSSEDVFNGDDATPAVISKRFSKSSFSIENSGLSAISTIPNGIKNIVPVDSSPEKPIKRYCSVDITKNAKGSDEETNDINVYAVNSFSSLPRTSTAATDKQIPNGVLARATSFSGSPYADIPNNFTNRSSEEQRKTNLNLLIEQRRRSISKLRGLIIPEKVPEIPSMVAPITDLPEIKSSNSILNKPRPLTKQPDYSSATPVRISPQLVSPPPWKSPQNNNLPKYSPAFKRKSLQLYSSPLQTDDTTNGNNTNGYSTEIKKTPVKPPRTSLVNGNGYRKSSLSNGDSPKSLDSAIDNFDYVDSDKSITPNKTVMHLLHDSRTDDDSDNDSAVSSSQSSYASRDYSSPPSPHSALCRTPSSDTTSSTTSTLTSGSHPSSCCGSSSSAGCGRVLKPQSVEAINRKNILASAKCRSGRDLNGSPLIQRKFDEDSTDGNEEPTPPTSRYSRIKQVTVTTAYSETDSTEPSSLEYTLAQQEPASDSDTEIRKWVRSEAKYVTTPTAPTAVQQNNTLVRGRRSLLEDSDTGDLMDMLNGTKPSPIAASRSKTEMLLMKEKRSTSVNDIRKTFEKIAPVTTNGGAVLPNGRSGKMSNGVNGVNGVSNGLLTSSHQRISSLDSTASEGSSGVSSMLANGQNNHSGSSNNLQSGDFGSISSLASSTSVISQQELQQLIDEANAASEGPCSHGGTSGPNTTMALGDALVIVLHREAPGSSVGITLAGGADYETKEITIHKVLIGSPADRDGRVQKGDRVLSINGKSMRGVTHRESLAILKAPRSEVVLVTSKSKVQSPPLTTVTSKSPRKSLLSVSSDSASETNGSAAVDDKITSEVGVFTVSLQKEGASLGFSLEGGQDSPLGDKPLVIKKIFTGGAADKVDILRAGDELLRVNDQIVSNLSRVEVWSLMKRLPNGTVDITVRR